MKTKHIMKYFFCCLTLATVLFLCGCSDQNADKEQSVDSVSIFISIDFPEKAKLPDLKTMPFRVEEDTSVLQAVELYGNVNEISILVDTTSSTLAGIDGVINDVTLQSRTWQYKINGELKNKAINDIILKDGDHLELVYAKEPQ